MDPSTYHDTDTWEGEDTDGFENKATKAVNDKDDWPLGGLERSIYQQVHTTWRKVEYHAPWSLGGGCREPGAVSRSAHESSGQPSFHSVSEFLSRSQSPTPELRGWQQAEDLLATEPRYRQSKSSPDDH